jgi:hypothetical protein
VPYFKCASCRIRVSKAGAGTDLAHASCPACGQPLQSVASVAELVGFRPPDGLGGSVPRVVQRVADISGGRQAAEAHLDAQRWLSEGGSLPPDELA